MSGTVSFRCLPVLASSGIFTSSEPLKLELNPLSLLAVPGGGSSGLWTGSESPCSCEVVAGGAESLGSAAVGAAAAGSPPVGTTGTLVVSSGNGLDSVGFCPGG